MLKSFLHAIGLAITLFALTSGASAQEAGDDAPAAVDRSATGGAQTLEDILRRQRGEEVPLDQGQAAPSDPPEATPGALATRGGASDSTLWRAIRQGNSESFTVSIPDKKAATLVQDDGESWLKERREMVPYVGWALVGILGLLSLFFLIRGPIRVDSGMSGVTINRFKSFERFGHWLLGISFIVLAITGLSVFVGREALVPAIDWMRIEMYGEGTEPRGKELFASWALIAKWLHNNVSWAFMLGLLMIFVMWVLHNIPTWTDVKWLLKGGGFLTKGHPSARNFNAGQKIIFWLVILLGAFLSASGLSMLFPYEVPMFGETFKTINVAAESIGRPVGLESSLSPIQEMQLAQLWHTIIAIVMTLVVIAHIYIGTIGMQGAFSAMGSGKVDVNWAEQHHDLWVEKLRRKGKLAERDEDVVRARPVSFDSTPAE